MKVLPLLLAVSLLTPFCTYPSNPQPPPGSHQLPITFQQWIHSGACSATHVSMWVRYKGTPYPSSQQDIISYMSFEFPSEVGPDGSMSVWAIQQALWEWSFFNTRDEFYVSQEKRQAVADLKKGITVGNPTIVITNYGLHSRMAKGGSWMQLPNYQPNVEYITTFDPADYGPRSDTVGYWVDYVGAGEPGGSYIRAIQVSGQRGSGLADLAEFDYWGGTYYGEEDPPDGCPECQPIEPEHSTSLLRPVLRLFAKPLSTRLAAGSTSSWALTTQTGAQRRLSNRRRPVGPEEQRNHAVRRIIYVPKPHANTAADVVENLMAGMRQTNLSTVEEWADLDALLAQRRITISSVDRIQSLSGHPEYWLLTLRSDGQPFAQALVSEVGWLLSVMRAYPGVTVLEPKAVTWAKGVVAELGYSAPEVRRVHMSNNLTRMSGSAEYDPFFEVTSPGQPPVYVTQEGAVYKVDAAGTGIAFWTDGQRRLARIR